MSVLESKCNSCGKPLREEWALEFKCPSCGNGVIGRCTQCRDQSAKYNCLECGFTGP